MDATTPVPARYRGVPILEAIARGSIPAFDRASVARLLSLPALAYVTGATEDEICVAIEDPAALGPRQRESLDAALRFGALAYEHRREYATNDDRPSAGREPAYDALTSLFLDPAAGDSRSFADALRHHAGGDLPAIPASGDELVSFLLDAAAASIGGLLVQRTAEDGPWHFPRPAVRRFGQFDDAKLARLVAADERLRPLFPEVTDSLSSAATFLDTTGRGGGLQVATLPELISCAAAIRAGWPLLLDQGRFLTEVVSVAEEVRRLAGGGTVEVPAWVDFVGLEAPADLHAQTALGVLSRPPAPVDGVTPTGGVAPGLRLTTTFPLALDLSFEPRSDAPSAMWEAAQREFQRRIDHVRLAFLLAAEHNNPLAIQVASRTISNPLNWPGRAQPWTITPFTSPLEASEIEAMIGWAAKISAHHHPSIDLGVRRALSATTPARDTEDRLVDAVIALENLVGGGTGKKGRRRSFSAGVAGLVASVTPARAAVRSRALQLYDARSDIVHGRRQLAIREAGQLTADAIGYALNGLRWLLDQSPQLITNRRRGQHLDD